MWSFRKWCPFARDKAQPVPKQGIFYGWWVVVAGSLINCLGTVHFNGFSVLFLPLSRDLHLSRTATALAFSLSRAEGAFEGPAAGYLIDRLGARVMLVAGAILAGIGYILFSRVDSLLTFILVYGGLVTLGINAGFSHALIAAVNNWFVRRRGLALAIVLSAGPLGATFLIPLLSLGVFSLGWRTSVVLVGLVLLVIAAPISLLVRRSPEAIGLFPDGDTPSSGGPNFTPVTTLTMPADFTVRQAMRTIKYWHFILATMLRVAVISSITVHFIPIMVWKGLPETQAAILLGVLNLTSIPLRLALGWLGDRWNRTYVISLALVLGIVSLALLYWSSSPVQLWLFIPFLAATEAAGPVNWALLGDFYGRRNFATMRGVMTFFYTWGAVALPVIAGAIYDRNQSYDLALGLFAAVLGLATLAFALLRHPSRRGGEVEKTPGSPGHGGGLLR